MDQTPVLSQQNQKTVLVVDDDQTVLKFVAALLTNSNCHVLTADGGKAALKQSDSYKGDIHLLLSDFQMAGVNGVDLATQLTHIRPAMKVLLMSGFADGMLVLNDGWHFLPTPFVASQLRTLVMGLISPDRASRFAAKPVAA